ncbi:hypothetical protein [Schaalia hyovaginalis]|uniref:hypothetical protein n=1 Tax=Schaalia hyovaginalis TaxID=29316 RepID=UPI0031B5D181
MTPPILRDDTAGQHRPILVHALPAGLQAQVIQPGEGGHVGGSEGSVAHVEVFQMSGVEPSSSGGLDPYPGTDAPTPTDTAAARPTPSTEKSQVI